MKNSHLDMQFPHGADALQGNVTASATINEAEKSARALKALVGRNPGQVQDLEVTRPQSVEERS
jgi:hypothetical protein